MDQGEGYDPNAEEEYDSSNLLSYEDYWTVISGYIGENGLIRQQTASFNEFVDNTMQEIVDERRLLTLDQHDQYTGLANDETVRMGHELR